MGYKKYLETENSVEVDDELIVEAINSGSGISLGSIAIAALASWQPADLKSLAEESDQAEIDAVTEILEAMRAPLPVDAP